MAEILSKSAYAVYRGVAVSAVSNWIARDKLTGTALTKDGRVNVDEADRQLAGNIDPGRGNPTPLLTASRIAEPRAATQAASDAGSLADIRLRTDTLRLQELERTAAIARGELISAAEAERAWAAELEDLIASMEQFILDLPEKLGLDREGAIAVRAEWRAFRERRARQAEAAAEDGARAA